LQQDFNGKAVDCVMEAINVLARLVLTVVLVVINNWFSFLLLHSRHDTFPEQADLF